MDTLPKINSDNLLFGGMTRSSGLAGNHVWSKPKNGFWTGLSNVWNNFTTGVADRWADAAEQLKGSNLNDSLASSIGAATGAVGFLNGLEQTTRLNDNTQFVGQLNNMQAMLGQNLNSLSQFESARNNLYSVPRANAKDYDLTPEQKTGSVISSLGQAFQAGASIHPALGVGAAMLGLIPALNAVQDREIAARAQANFNNFLASETRYNLLRNQDKDLNSIQGNTAAYNAVRSVARGGKIERQQMSINEFASKVVGKKDYPDRPIRSLCNGGVRIRFKAK